MLEIMFPAQVAALDCSAARARGELSLKLADERRLRSWTVVIASGARYRRPAVEGLGEFEGKGVWYRAAAAIPQDRRPYSWRNMPPGF